jgi:hypothetical protein
MEIIYCSGGNRRLAEIAHDAGFLLGSQLPETVYLPIGFADQNWKQPNRDRYLQYLRQHRPRMATVLDWEQPEQLPEVLAWAEDVAAIVDIVMIIPKVLGGIHCLPTSIGGKPIRLAFSYPTGFGAASWDILPEMIGWPHGVHILGGQPHDQMEIAAGRIRRKWRKITRQGNLFASGLDVRSVDGNYFQLKATKYCEHWDNGRWIPDGGVTAIDAPYEAFRRSCANIMAAWRRLLG